MRKKNIWINIWLQILLQIKPEQNTLKKYPKNQFSQSLIIFEKEKSDFFTIQPVIQYLFKEGI